MVKIVLDQATMKFISLCENITGATVKDCIVEDNLVLYIIKEGDIGKAIGKKGFNVKRLEHTIKKKVKMVEFHTEVGTFIGNLMMPAKIKDMEIAEGIVKIIADDLTSRGLMIGRDAKILRFNENVVKRYFDIKEIKVK